MTTNPDEAADNIYDGAIRRSIVDACRSLEILGLNRGVSGNISVRSGNAMLITPTATPYDSLSAPEIARIPLSTPTNGDKPVSWEGPKRPSSEWQMHRDILASRPEVRAIVHAHPIHCTAISMTRRGIPPFHYMVATFGGDDVRCSGYAEFGTGKLAMLVLAALEDRSACLVANHGMVTCGRNLSEALTRAVDLEVLAQQYLQSVAAGRPRLLSEVEITAAITKFGAYRP